MEKLIYLIWDHPPEGSNDWQGAIVGDCAQRLLALDPLGLSINVDDADSNIPGSTPLPQSELAVVAQVSIWLHAHDFRAEYEAILGEHGIRRAGYLVTESSWTDYGRNEHHPSPRDWPDGARSPGVSTLTMLERPARLDPDVHEHVEGRRDRVARYPVALERVRQGTFGQCEGCQQQIPRTRLNAVPHARFCVECQRKSEQG